MQNYKARSKSEESLLKLSICMTIFMASVNLIIGTITNSSSIVFDGFYSYLEAGMTALSLLVAKLIARDVSKVDYRERERYFQFGFWHFEPMVLAFNSVILICVALYEFLISILNIISGGHDINFEKAVIYSCVASFICLMMGVYENRCNREIKSDFIALDAKSWIVAGYLLLAVVIAFLCAMLLRDSAYDWIIPYVDSMVLMFICLFILPSAICTMKSATFEIFQMTSPDLDSQVREALYPIVIRHGFLDFYTYVTKVGRSRIIEIYLIVPAHYPIKRIASLDAIRHEIGNAIGGLGEERWLTISFTTQKKWAI
ncbi:cation transporter [Candidatus Liberibacter asiaticus]|uniref:Cation diffusion facilitator family transporter, putative n=2 Tax=Liberibacter asiaticus TaxID=34021 RepID=C6XF15_LIBAP|nr:cation transporter [Candidatus Liberibacter asiaticus]ACT56967.1 cation diffusion facilitator family transporter, putative [Candidatus Liberibacter asiaticus str. psy62]AGH17067.1 cation diffusion facilitator family transporter [Candidatus Liberibacter asiaticus str. gxpsy]ALK07391.1 cation transporter [Candidatus Liberibacter asiaticus]ASK52882.1 cation transporter [Candidatus Liberibacter asiaticus]AWL14200.1 cation transporter [Candidatus Liberibacter asiaticus]